jgi:two-component system, response regulator PdtaR
MDLRYSDTDIRCLESGGTCIIAVQFSPKVVSSCVTPDFSLLCYKQARSLQQTNGRCRRYHLFWQICRQENRQFMKRVLIAEDEILVAMDLQITLSEIGYSVIGISSSGEQTIELTRAERPDIILMDVHLRGAVSGLQAAEKIQEEFAIPILFVTAAPDDSTLEKINSSKMNALLSKPISTQSLQIAINKLIK